MEMKVNHMLYFLLCGKINERQRNENKKKRNIFIPKSHKGQKCELEKKLKQKVENKNISPQDNIGN